MSSLRILLVKANMGFEEADVIVNSTNPNLDLHRGQLSIALLNRAGPKLQQDCREKYPEGMSLGKIAVTKAGDLKWVEEIYHCVLPRWDENTGKKTFVDMITTLLTMVNDSGWKTMAIPALGTGRLAYPRDMIAKLMYDIVTKFGRDHPDTSIRDVLFVCHPSDAGTIKSFTAEHNKYRIACGGNPAEEIEEQEITTYREQQMANINARSERY